MRPITKIILHCSANGPSCTFGVKEIRRFHTMPVSQGGRGWSDIGYHYVIKRDGTLEEGRPLEKAGAHTTGYNAESIGICLVGGVESDGRTPDDNFTTAQFETLARLIESLRSRWPKATIHGHSEFANKACPVFSVPKFLKSYGIEKDPSLVDWDSARWPHFKPGEFSALWGKGPMPLEWKKTLDALEDLRSMYGKPLYLERTSWKDNRLTCDISVPSDKHAIFIRWAMDAGFTSARTVTANAVRVYGVWE